ERRLLSVRAAAPDAAATTSTPTTATPASTATASARSAAATAVPPEWQEFGRGTSPDEENVFGQLACLAASQLQLETGLPLPSPMMQDRRGLLERARLGVKMGQRPEHALLVGSLSESRLRQTSPDKRSLATELGRATAWKASPCSDVVPGASVAASRHGPPPSVGHVASRGSPVNASIRLYGDRFSEWAAQGTDELSRSAPTAPRYEAPQSPRQALLSSRASRGPGTGAGSPERSYSAGLPRSGLCGTAATIALGESVRLGDCGPAQRSPRSLPSYGGCRIEDEPYVLNSSGWETDKHRMSARAKPGLAREDPAPARRASHGLASDASSPVGNLSCPGGADSTHGSGQQPPRGSSGQAHWQETLPSAPPPSPSTGRRAMYPTAEAPGGRISPRSAAATCVPHKGAWLPQGSMVQPSLSASLDRPGAPGSTPMSTPSSSSGGTPVFGQRSSVVPRLDLRKVQQLQKYTQGHSSHFK
ncbi:unnamed protein product, partial [Polarella glacialis]